MFSFKFTVKKYFKHIIFRKSIFYFTFIYKNASALQVLGAEAFYDEYVAHVVDKKCDAKVCKALLDYTIKPELYEVGLTTGQTPFGHTVPIYDMERTICDLLRSRSSMETQTFQGALKMYARRKDKDLRTLMRYAGMFRVEKILRQYLEVLL